MLDKQIIPLNIAASPNQKVDPQSLTPGTLTLLKNARFRKANRIDKRPGHTALTMEDKDGNTLTDIKKIIGTEDGLLAWVGNELWAYNRGQDFWTYKCPYYACETTIDSIDDAGEGAQCLYDNGLTYYVYTRCLDDRNPYNGGAVILYIVDEVSGETVLGPQTIADGRSPKIIKFDSKIFVIYNDQKTIYGVEVLKTETNWLDTPVSLATDYEHFNVASFLNYSVYVYDDTRLIIAYADDTTPTTLNIRYFDSTLTELSGAYALRQITGMVSAGAIDTTAIIESSSADKFFVIAVNDGGLGGSRYAIIDNDGSLDTGATALTVTGNESAVGHIYGEAYNDGANDGIRFWTSLFDITTKEEYYVEGFAITNGGTQSAFTEDMRELFIVAPPFEHDGERYFVCAKYDPNYSICLVKYESTGYYTVVQVLWGRARAGGVWDTSSSYVTGSNTGTVTQISSGKYRFACGTKDVIDGRIRIVSVEFDFDYTRLFNGIQIGKSVVISGTNPVVYDGSRIFELGFFSIPQQPVTLTQAGSGSLADGAYSVLIQYEYTDRGGNLYRSAPGEAKSITVSGGSGSASIQVNFKFLSNSNLFRADASDGKVLVNLYATEAGGSIYYRARGAVSYSSNDDYVNDFDALDDTWTISQIAGTEPILYTDSGEIPTSPVPPMLYLSIWNDRLWGAGEPENKLVFYSKLKQNAIAPEMTEALTISTQDIPSEVVSVNGFSDKLILSTQDRFYYAYGEGPDNTGQGGAFSKFEEILGIVGPINSDSIAISNQGLWFHSIKGVYLLDRGLNVSYEGAIFEDAVGDSIIKSLVTQDRDSVLFVSSAGTIENDIFFNSWSQNVGISTQDAAIYNGQVYVLDDSDQVWKDDRTTFKDGATAYAMSLETGWISLAGVLGFQRFYRLFFKATYKSTHSLKISLAYDYGDYVDAVTIDPTDGTDDDVYRFTVYPTIQKCEAFRIKIEEVITDGTAGTQESLQFNFIGVQIGRKRGLPKIKDAQKVGVTNI